MDSQKEERKEAISKSSLLGEYSQMVKVDLDALMKQVLLASHDETFEEDFDDTEILTSTFSLLK